MFVRARSLHDLPTVLVYCEESQRYIRETVGLSCPDKLHSCVTPNVNYIEWMMGYPENWTRAELYQRDKKTSRVIDNQTLQRDKFQVKKEQKKTPSATRFNGMHALMQDNSIDIPKRDIRSVAAVWRGLSQERRDYYSNLAKTM